jgi:protease-4
MSRMPQPQSSTTRSNGFLDVLSFLGKVWIVVTAVIGSLFVGLVGLIVVLLLQTGGETAVKAPVSEKVIKEGSSEKIAVVNLSGMILDEASADPLSGSSGVISARKITRLLDHLKDDNSVKAVVLRINSPGGAVVASDEIYRKVREVRKIKPVVTSMGDSAASGGYYIAAGTDKIVANPATITGSIGVIAEFPKLTGLYEKVGVEMRTFKSGTYKDIGSMNRDVTGQESEILTKLIQEDYDQFVQAIVDGRKMEEAKVRQLADGRIYTGKQAKENGLIDELGTFDDAVKIAGELGKAEGASVVEFSDQSFLQTLFEARIAPMMPFAELSKVLPRTQGGVYYLMEF